MAYLSQQKVCIETVKRGVYIVMRSRREVY